MILMGMNDAAVLKDGWHPVQEGPGGIPCRWMSPRATVFLAAGASVQATVSAPGEIAGRRPGLSVYGADGTLLGHCADLGREGEWTVVQLSLGRSTQAGGELCAFAVESIDSGSAVPLGFIPHEIFGNGDLRELGVQISTIRVCPNQAL